MLKIYLHHSFFRQLMIVVLTSIFIGNVAAETIIITSKDGINITADTYIVNHDPQIPVIVLFHQAGWSRGEYLEIAPKLNQLGFNCIAVDLRSGEAINDIENLTARHARESNKQTRYIDALPDMLSSLHFIDRQFPENEIIAWGSSYSASLVLYVAGTYPDLVEGAVSFAPGEYFTKQGKSNTWIQEAAATIHDPVFITSAREEESNWSAIYHSIQSDKKTSFIPNSKGNHGSRALWASFPDSEDYWKALTAFLENNF